MLKITIVGLLFTLPSFSEQNRTVWDFQSGESVFFGQMECVPGTLTETNCRLFFSVDHCVLSKDKWYKQCEKYGQIRWNQGTNYFVSGCVYDERICVGDSIINLDDHKSLLGKVVGIGTYARLENVADGKGIVSLLIEKPKPMDEFDKYDLLMTVDPSDASHPDQVGKTSFFGTIESSEYTLFRRIRRDETKATTPSSKTRSIQPAHDQPPRANVRKPELSSHPPAAAAIAPQPAVAPKPKKKKPLKPRTNVNPQPPRQGGFLSPFGQHSPN